MSGTEDDRIHTRSMTAGRSGEPSQNRQDQEAQGQGQSGASGMLGDDLRSLATRLRRNASRSQSRSPNPGPDQDDRQSRESSRGRGPGSRGSRATPRSRSHADSEGSWTPDEGNDVTTLPDWARELIQRQTQLMESMTSANASRTHREDNSKVPHYNCKRLTPEATAAEIEDWITAIKEGNQQKPGRSDTVQISWALSQVAYEMQTSWRGHRDNLAYEDPTSEATLEDFWKFIRREAVDPELFDRAFREQLLAMRQGKDESPRDLFARWQVLVRKTEERVDFEGNRRLAFDYFSKLTEPLKLSYGSMNSPYLQHLSYALPL
ncbi:hypothetical protein F4861DRAFT_540010 [Xylaria intraflava]|nr:hypothetical protein F4861DRAFT_540010 [Xylaria intraflava]